MENFEILPNIGFCKKTYEEGEVKVKDRDHITGKNEHQQCNLNLSMSKKFLLCFTIFKTMIHILSFMKLETIISK